MIWTNEFITLALNGLPKDKYRQRLQAELADHLMELSDELEASGLSPEEAHTRALALMGDPEELNPSYRESWVRRASNWKYCLGAFCKAALHAVLINALARWVICMPILLAATLQIFAQFGSDSLPPIFLFTFANFLPGLWFCARELSERFAIHPHRKKLLLCGFFVAWFFESMPFLTEFIPRTGLWGIPHFLNGLISIPLLLGQTPILILLWNTSHSARFVLRIYTITTLVLCILFARFYRPRRNQPFLLSDKT